MTEPSAIDEDESREAIALLRGLMANPALRYSTEDPRSPEQFHFLVQMTQPVSDAAGTVVSDRITSMFVARDGRRVGVLCTSASGVPYCVLKEGLCVILDRNHPGGLLIFRGGAPTFLLSSEIDRDGLAVDLSYRADRTKGDVTLDIASLIHRMLNKLQKAKFDPDNRDITIETKKAVYIITLTNNHATIPVESFSAAGRHNGTSVVLLGPDIDSRPPFDTNALSENSVRQLGLPVRVLEARDMNTLDLRVPPDFGNNPRETEAAFRLRNLLVPSCPLNARGIERI